MSSLVELLFVVGADVDQLFDSCLGLGVAQVVHYVLFVANQVLQQLPQEGGEAVALV